MIIERFKTSNQQREIMPGTTAELRRSLLARVKGLDALEVQVEGPFRVKLLARPSPGQDKDELALRIQDALSYIKILGVGYEISIIPAAPIREAEESLRGRFRLASLSTNPTISGLREALARLVPSLGRLVLEEDFSAVPASLKVFAAYSDGTSSDSLIQDVRSAMTAVGFAGLSFEVSPLPSNDPRNDLRSPGFIVPRREMRLTNLAEQEEELFAKRLQHLMADESPKLPLVDDFRGSKVLCTISLRRTTPISCFLPVYDRVYAVMPPETKPVEGDYYLKHFGLKETDFLLYCRREKIIPVFKFGLGTYPEQISRTFIEDPSLAFVGGRDLDYIAARYAWQEAAYLRPLREDRSLSQEIYELAVYLGKIPSPERHIKGMRDLLLQMLRGAEAFEGEMWRMGHLSLPYFSPAMVAARSAAALPTDEAGMTTFFDIQGSALHLSMAQAFGASLHTGLIVNEPLLEFCARYFLPETRSLGQEQVSRMGEILKALEIAYSDRIPAAEYLEVFDEAETRRTRAIIASVLENPDGSPARDDEIRERVRAFNNGVHKLARWAVDTADVDVVGDLAQTGEIASGNAMLQSLLKFAGLKTVGHIVGMIAERIIDDTSIGDSMDKVRGAINRVPAQSVRLYRVRSKLKRH
jgi:hypothetical protein